jgi:hypothetical protein
MLYICFYARYTVWSGNTAWGDRYVSTTTELLAFIAVPLLMRHRADAGRLVRAAGIALIAASAVVQAASVAFWCPLELYQMEARGYPTFIVGLRLENILAFALGKMDAWGLNYNTLKEDPWDYVHITTWNFLPFLLRRVGEAPAWVVDITLAAWSASLAALAAVLLRLRRVLSLSAKPAPGDPALTRATASPP